MQIAQTPVGATSKVTQGFGPGQTCAYCHGFMKIPPLIRSRNGKMYLNPDFESVGRFEVRAEPWDVLLGPGESTDLAMTVPAEEADLGDLLISELLGGFTPAGQRNVTVEMLSTQTTRTFQNAPIWNTLLLGNAQLNCCLPCCTLVQATASLALRVTNNDAAPTNVRIVGRGKRFLTRNDELRARMLMYWNSIPSFPYFLTFDNMEVTVPAGETVSGFMTVPGTGDFEVKGARCEVLPAGTDPDVVLVTLTEQVGRELQSDPLPLGSFVATPTLVVPGFPGDLYRAASACSCPPVSQLLKRNTKLRVDMTNTSGADVTVRLVFPGCFHEVSECPPGRSMDRIRSLEPTIGPLLIPQRDYCPPDVAPAAQPEPAPAEVYAPQPAAQPVYSLQPQAAPAAPRTMFVPGYGTVVQGTGSPLEYIFDQYEPGPGGTITPKPEFARAHGLPVGVPWSPPVSSGPMNGMNGLGARPAPRLRRPVPVTAPQRAPAPARRPMQLPPQQVVQRGQRYWDPLAGEWRIA